MMVLRRAIEHVIGKTYDTFAEWLADHPEPSLQELVERYGGYSRVPPEAWAEFDRRMERWREEYKQRQESGGT
jgi:hypothetical protein